MEIIMPKMGDAMTEGKVIRWYKKPGDAVKKGEPVLEIETDKVNLDLEAEADGTLGELEVEEGAMAPIGATLATLQREGEAKATPKPAPVEPAKKAEPAKTKESGEEAKPEKAVAGSAEKKDAAASPPLRAVQAPAAEQEGERRISSPLARRMARELGVDLRGVQGSGPAGRIVAADIQNAAKSAPRLHEAKAPSPPPRTMAPRQSLQSKEIPLSAMRRTIAKRLAESTGPIPHFYLTIDVDVTQLSAMRTELNEISGVKTSVNDFVVRAVALSMLHHPNINASFEPDLIRLHGDVHVGIAVATPEGLITPVVRNADQKSIPDIATEVRALAERARSRKLKPDEYQGSTFTISNLGKFGIEEFTAIINPPNAAILAVGAAMPRPVVIEGEIVVRDRMKMTLSCDHRVIDGAAGAEYLTTLAHYLEQPLRLLL